MAAPFYKVQAGAETIVGTAVAATAKWHAYRLRPTIGDREIVQPEEDRGSLAGAFTGYTVKQLADMGNLEGDVTFEDVILPLLMAIESVSPTQPDSSGAPNEYLWSFEPSWSAANSPKTFTVEWGDDVQVWESEYCFAAGLIISGEANGVWQVSAPLRGRQHTTTTFTGSLSDRTLERANFNKGTLYMDDAGGTIGTTELSCKLVSFSWELPDHYVEYFAAGGQLYFCGLSEMKVKPTLAVTLILDSTTKTYITTKYSNETVQLVRLRTTGTTMDSTAKYINLDGAYRIVGVNTIDEQDGLSIVQMSLAGEYDSTWAKMFAIAVLNGVSAIP